MATGRGEICVGYASFGQLAVERVVDFEEEIFCAAIEYDVVDAVLQCGGKSHDGVFVPSLRIAVLRAEAVSHVPVFREWADIATSTC